MVDDFEITDEHLTPLKGRVVVITGCASGIGLATTELLLSLGARVVTGDISPPPITHSDLKFQRTDVTSWSDLTNLFAFAHETHSRIDHVFANAGIAGTTNYIDLKTDEATGQLLEPSFRTLDIDLRGVLNTSALAFHYMRTQSPPGGSVVVTASASAFQRFCIVDYASAKHGVLGFMRGMVLVFKSANLPIRINAIGPSWTRSGIVPAGAAEAAGKASQSADVVARGVAVLMADEARNGQFIYTVAGKHKEIEESVLQRAAGEIVGDELDDNTVIYRMLAMREAASKEAAEAAE